MKTIEINVDEAVINAATDIAVEACIGILSDLVDAQLKLLVELEAVFGMDERGNKIEDEESEIIAKLRHHIDQLGSTDRSKDAAAATRTIRAATAFPLMLHALEMVRDADEDCKRDGLQTMPYPARATIDRAILAATAE